MTELFGRLAPGADLETARAELRAVHGAMVKRASRGVSGERRLPHRGRALRDQITSPARTVLLVLLAASALVFVIACSNVANLILARSVRREGELAIRAALGASAGALRRTLLAESLLLCGAGAILGVLIARPMVAGAGALRRALLGARARRDGRRQPAVGRRRPGARRGGAAGLRAAAAVGRSANGIGLSSGSVRITSGTNRRLRAVRGHADRRVVRAARRRRHAADDAVRAAAAQTGFNTRNVLALNVPVVSYAPAAGRPASTRRRSGASASCPASSGRARARSCRGAMPALRPGLQFTVEGYAKAQRRGGSARAVPHRLAGLLRALGVPIIAGRDFNDGDRRDGEQVVIVSRASRSGCSRTRTRSTAADVDRSGDEVHRRQHRRRAASSASSPTSTTRTSCRAGDDGLSPVRAGDRRRPAVRPRAAGSVRARAADHADHPRAVAADQPVERPATLDDVRAEVLAPDRLNALVFGGFAGVALTHRGRRRGRRAGVLGERAHAPSRGGCPRVADCPPRGPPRRRHQGAARRLSGFRYVHGECGVSGEDLTAEARSRNQWETRGENKLRRSSAAGRPRASREGRSRGRRIASRS